jgi:hypothetical protein
VLIAKAQMRVLCRAAGLSPDTFEQQFDAVFYTPPDRKGEQEPRRGDRDRRLPKPTKNHSD